MCASMRKAMARAAYMGELVVGVLGRLVIVLGSALGLQTWRKCCGAHPSVILPSCRHLYGPCVSCCLSRPIKALILFCM